MSSKVRKTGGCLAAFMIFVVGQIIASTAWYFTTEASWAIIEKNGWISDPDGAGLTGVFIGMFVYFVIAFVVNAIGKRLTGVDGLDHIPYLP